MNRTLESEDRKMPLLIARIFVTGQANDSRRK